MNTQKANWKTTFFGTILAISMALQQYGVTIGKVGKGDYVGLSQIIAAVGLGISAADAKKKESK